MNQQRSLGASVLEAVGVSHTYRLEPALRPTNFALSAGEQVAIMGPSGCGKTTLINILGGLERPTAGFVRYRGKELSYRDRDLTEFHRHAVGFVFQSFALIPSLTVSENVDLTLVATGVDEAERRAECMELLRAVRLDDYADRLPEELSGGQRQRVAVARCLAHRPAVVLADEPTGNLDSENGMIVVDLLSSVCRERNAALLVVTHDPEVAARMEHTVQMKDGAIIEAEPVLPLADAQAQG